MGNETAGRASLLRRLGSAAAGLVLVTGCAAGQNAQTVEQTPSIDGIQAEAGSIAIRAAAIASPESGTGYAKGSSAPLRMVLINRGSQADRLVSVSSPVAGGVQLSAGSGAAGSSAASSPGSASPSVSPSSAASGSASPAASASASVTGSPTGSATASRSATKSGSASTSPPASATSTASASSPAASSASVTSSPSAPAASTPIDLPPRQSIQVGMGDGGATVTLTGLTTDLYPSQSVPVTLTFASGTSVTVVLAVQLTTEAPNAPTVSVATHPSEPNG